MSVASDFLTQARHLLTYDRRRPKQASLRRAVSAAYYALFHLLTEEAARRLVGEASKPLRQQVQRAFDHGTMRQCCRSFSGGALPGNLAPLIAAQPSPSLRVVARHFLLLQDARHVADYDMSRDYTRANAEALIEQAEQAFAAWRTIRVTNEAKTFLVSLLLWKAWNRT